MKNKRLWWILGIATAPFILMLCLHLGLAIQRYFRFNINVPNVEAADWFMFAGSYLGGAMTLLGVIVTLKYERILKLQNHFRRVLAVINASLYLQLYLTNFSHHLIGIR